MSINHQFSIAVHMMAGLAYHKGHACVSSVLAESVNTSPAFVRRILAKLSKAGLIETATGKKGACWMSRDPESVSLLEIYRAVDAPKVFAIHTYPAQPLCQISCNIKLAMDDILDETQRSMEERLASFTVADVLKGCEEPDEEEMSACDGLVPIESLKGGAAKAPDTHGNKDESKTAKAAKGKVAPSRAGLTRASTR